MLRSRASFVQTVLPLQTIKQATRTNIWEDEWQRNDTRALEWLDRGITPTDASLVATTLAGQPGSHLIDCVYCGTTPQKTRTAVDQCRQCPTYWNVPMPPGAVQKTWQNLPHQLWPVPDTGRDCYGLKKN
ncbi:hypothetical protein CgunFtcFv8_024569 [Champsocephalus gunnari]|uniref:Uncharacterized protein n=1 Tax=Champsocephalus gunnari TaxID=52237 RepID=A0AAN8DD44_CHAGU|nr:hypothetical protein CgunFtcFv8_024569 [Champsocephalus gunnari]